MLTNQKKIALTNQKKSLWTAVINVTETVRQVAEVETLLEVLSGRRACTRERERQREEQREKKRAISSSTLIYFIFFGKIWFFFLNACLPRQIIRSNQNWFFFHGNQKWQDLFPKRLQDPARLSTRDIFFMRVDSSHIARDFFICIVKPKDKKSMIPARLKQAH